MVTLKNIAEFIFRYVAEYRAGYEKAVAPPPKGPGYPEVAISPFLEKGRFTVYVTDRGVVINEERPEPSHQWYIAGGPALKVDYEPTKTPKAVLEALEQHGLKGKPIGIYRIVSKTPLDEGIWRGEIKGITETISAEDEQTGIQLTVHRVASGLDDLISRLTFGAFGKVLDIHLPKESSPIGVPHVVKKFGVFPADLNNRRYFSHLEIYGQSDRCAWDSRLASVRAQQDLRRDFAQALSSPSEEGGGSISFGSPDAWVGTYTDRLERLKTALAELRTALSFRGEDIEAVFHVVLEKHPLLLDVYGTCESKPRFQYPDGSTSPIGKSYLEPDFLIVYPNKSYKLIEIERPSKKLATVQGQPSAQVGQAVFQTAEWKHFIKSHYQEIVERYPGIQSKCKTCVIMSRTRQGSFSNAQELHEYIGLMMDQFNIDEFLTYDDLYERASNAYTQLSGLRPPGI